MKNFKFVIPGVLLLLIILGCGSTAGLLSGPKQGLSMEKRVAGGKLSSANASGEFHVTRTEQLSKIPAGSTVGIISGSGSLGLFLAADLESAGFVVKELNLYSLLTPQQQAMTDPGSDFTFLNYLAADASTALSKVTNMSWENTAATDTDPVNLQYVIDKLYAVDSLQVESQRVSHYLTLVENLKDMIKSLNVDYIIVVGPVYQELSFAMKIYETSSANLIFTNIFVGDLMQWRSVISAPQKDENTSYRFDDKKEPMPYWELVYSRFVVEKINKNF